ncbi:GTPase IMAP family member 8-like isoform X2 [Pseudorasbora parva]|uniref:GTPase IMAP family member 8-like isoform X2 n=1 Tax=Pseudorasbora parva TaxID=51549 RepID=UPI00351E816F
MADELRVVLLGGHRSGKSKVANSFLNVKYESDQITTQCVKMEGNVEGRKILLVDTPGWWKCYQLCDTPERLKAELLMSTNICAPGPHVFLLVIEADFAFSEKHRKVAEDHVQFIGDDIWNQTIIVFTKLEHLGDKTIEHHVDLEGENLNKLTQKCGNRYVGFDTNLNTDGSQTKELFRQIEKLLDENKGHFFKVDATRMKDLEIKMKNVEEKAAARERQVLEKRRKLEEIQSADAGHGATPLCIVLLGWVLSGKTLAGSVILGADVSFDKTVKCVRTSGEVNGREITVVDTPSWWKFLPPQLNADSVETELLNAMDSSPNAILLAIPAETSFLEEQMDVILENMRPLGEDIWRKTMVLFTWGGSLGNKPIEYHIESEGNALVRLVEMCGNRYHLFESMRDNRTQVNQLLEKIDEMIKESALLESSDEHQRMKMKYQERETLSEWLLVKDVKKLLDEEWVRSDALKKELFKTMDLQMDQQGAVKKGKSIDLPLNLSGKVNSELFINKHQLKHALEREWNRREAVDNTRIQYKQKCLHSGDMSSCADEEDIQRSVAKVHDWYQRLHLSDYGSVSSYEEQDKTEPDRD